MARAHGQPYRAVLAASYAATLDAFCQLLQHERIDRFLVRADAIGDAHLAALAFHEPAKLTAERDRLRDEVGFGPTPEEFSATVAEMIAATQQFDATQSTPEPSV